MGDINFEKNEKSIDIHKKNLIDSDNNMNLTVDALTDINNIITGSNSVTLRKFNVKLHWYDKMYIDKDLIEDKLYQLIDKFIERKIDYKDFYSILINNTHPFYDDNEKTCKILFVSNLNYLAEFLKVSRS